MSANSASNELQSYHYALMFLSLGFFVWSGIEPRDRLTWFFEAGPVLVGLPLALWIHLRFGVTPLLIFILSFLGVLICIGGKYTYAHVPLGEMLKTSFGLERNYYDRFGHFMQGFGLVILFREIVLRNRLLPRGAFLFLVLTSFSLAFAAFYEFVEWWAALLLGEDPASFLAMQGDFWDSHWDMFLAWIGSGLSLVLLSKWHDRQLKEL